MRHTSAPKARPQCSLGQRPRSLSHRELALKARSKSQVVPWNAPTALMRRNYEVLGRWPRLHWGRAVGPEMALLRFLLQVDTRLHCGRAVGAERLSPTGRFIGSLRRACPESVEGISRGDRDVRFSRHVLGTDGSSGGAVSFENGEWRYDAGWRGVRSFASSG